MELILLESFQNVKGGLIISLSFQPESSRTLLALDRIIDPDLLVLLILRS